MVFKVFLEDEPVSDRQCRFSMRYCLQRLAEGGMEIRLFYSLQVRHSFNSGNILNVVLCDATTATRGVLQDPRGPAAAAEVRRPD
jgi:sulfur relay (sulfurtransferase) complex TusBCD TusD component (DsrE family)